MNINGDKITTVLGGIIAAAAAAEPITRGVGQGSLHQGDYFQLVMAVSMALFGWFTNKGKTNG